MQERYNQEDKEVKEEVIEKKKKEEGSEKMRNSKAVKNRKQI